VTATASAVLSAALSQIGVKYVWGGEAPGSGFDCSGLTQWAYKTAGVALPRTSQAQYLATTPVAASAAMPGDLVFSAGSDGTEQAPGHVGIYLGAGKYVDAPYTGTVISVSGVPSDAKYGRVPGTTMDAGPDGSAIATAAQSITGTAGCGSKPAVFSFGGVLGVGSVSITACQGKALVGGICLAAGAGVAVVGVLIIVAWGIGHTKAGAAAAGVVKGGGPVGTIAKAVA
jgi:hypothetical protein